MLGSLLNLAVKSVELIATPVVAIVKVAAEVVTPVAETTTEIIEDEREMTCKGVTKVYKPGEIRTIPSNMQHSAKAITTCKLTDIF